MKTCLIGVSGFGETHYNDLMREQEAGRSKLIAATVINPEEEANKCARLRDLGCEIYSDYRTMLERHGAGCDICFIPTGIHLHCPMTVDALRAGCNVFVEKPLAATVQEVALMKKVSAETKRFVAVGYQHIYTDYVISIKKLMRDGKLGRINSLSCMALWPRDKNYYSRNRWSGRLKIGDIWVLDSPFSNANAHNLNMMLFLAGKETYRSIAPLGVHAELYRANRIESADTAFIRIKGEDEVTINFCLTHACAETIHPVIDIKGENGTMRWYFEKSIHIEYTDGRTEEYDGSDPDMRRKIFDALVRRVEDGRGFVCDLDIAGTHTLCVDGVFQSARIADIPDNCKSEVPSKSSSFTAIEDIEALVGRCFSEKKLLSELDEAPDWAVPSKPFSLDGYTEFTGCAD